MNEVNKERIEKFTYSRGFIGLHTGDRLAKAIAIEAAELLECFQWDETCFDMMHVKQELADVLIYCQQMIEHFGWDEDEIIEEKMDENEKKYPIWEVSGEHQ